MQRSINTLKTVAFAPGRHPNFMLIRIVRAFHSVRLEAALEGDADQDFCTVGLTCPCLSCTCVLRTHVQDKQGWIPRRNEFTRQNLPGRRPIWLTG